MTLKNFHQPKRPEIKISIIDQKSQEEVNKGMSAKLDIPDDFSGGGVAVPCKEDQRNTHVGKFKSLACTCGKYLFLIVILASLHFLYGYRLNSESISAFMGVFILDLYSCMFLNIHSSHL